MNTELKNLIEKRDFATIKDFMIQYEAQLSEKGYVYNPVFGWLNPQEERYLEKNLNFHGYPSLKDLKGIPCYQREDNKHVAESFVETFYAMKQARSLKNQSFIDVVEVFS